MPSSEKKPPTPRQVRKQILDLSNALKAEITKIQEIESGFLTYKEELEKLIKQYNEVRLDRLINELVKKRLAYCPGCDKLVPENSFHFEERSGTHTVTRNTYYDYEEPYHYKYYECERCGKSINHNENGVREAWVREFKRQFSGAGRDKLPQELLLVLPNSVIPPEPIRFSDWDQWGSPYRERFEDVKHFYVRGPGVNADGWTIAKKRY